MAESKRDDATYTMGRSVGETERLIEQASLHERVTPADAAQRRGCGRDEGARHWQRRWRCRPGGGQLVGREGTVVGIAVNPKILETARERSRAGTPISRSSQAMPVRWNPIQPELDLDANMPDHREEPDPAPNCSCPSLADQGGIT